MHVLKINATLKEGSNYIDQWIKQKHSMQDRYDFLLDQVGAGHCEECSIEVTKNSVDMTLKFTKKDDLIHFVSSNPRTKLDNTMLLSTEMSITEE